MITDNKRELTQTVNGQTTSFEYDNMGRQTKVTAPGNVVTNTTYYPTGEVKRIDGATYPVEYTYNGLGMQATLKTFKDADTPQVTSWSYNNRGQMTAKTYADNSSVTYTYNGDGQLLTRTWARQVNGAPLVTTYSSEFHDDETGLVYYNYRYYSPSLGRWTKRDYIEELGGVNLYVITSNDIQNYFDLFGLRNRAKGHHIVPWELLNNPQLFDDIAADFLNSGAAIVQIPNGHNYSRHSAYNKVVRDLLENFRKSYDAPLTKKQAEEFLGIVKECPFIQGFNQVAPRGPQAIRAWFDREGFNLLPEELKQKALNALRRAQKSARSKIGKKVFSNMTKAGLKSTGMAWTLFIVFAMKSANASDQEISIAVYDELTFGLGSAANEAYWGLANEIAQGAMDKTFGYVHGEESKQNTSSGPKRPLLELPSEKSKRTLRAGDLIGW